MLCYNFKPQRRLGENLELIQNIILLLGELLASFELLLKDDEELPMTPPLRGDLYMVPFGIRPMLQRTRIEVPFI